MRSPASLRVSAHHATKGFSMKGTVRFYNEAKGFGFIRPDDGSTDIVIYKMTLERYGVRRLVEGQRVYFDTAKDRTSGTMAANGIEMV